ncbi:MAG: glycosyltransferase family 1 protein [Chloroflexia bacterium]
MIKGKLRGRSDTLWHPASTPGVVFDGRYVQDRYHGIGRYAFQVLKELIQVLPEVHFAVLRDPGAPESRFEWSALSAGRSVVLRDVHAHVFSLTEQVAVPWACFAEMHPTALYHSPYFALPWALPGRKSIITVHDCIFEHDARYMPQRWARLYYRLLMHASTRRARAIAVPSRATARDLRRFYRASKRKILVTPEAADPSFRQIEDRGLAETVRWRYSLPAGFVLAVGARRPHKNFAHLVRSLAHVEGATLVFVGDADERFPDETAEAATVLGERARFLGKVPEDDLPALYNLATVVACPSVIEGFGLPVLEAMSCGTPVVCSDIAVFREVAGEAAAYAPPTDEQAWALALRQILDSSERQASLSDAGLARSRQFTWRAAAEALIPVYRSLGITNSA